MREVLSRKNLLRTGALAGSVIALAGCGDTLAQNLKSTTPVERFEADYGSNVTVLDGTFHSAVGQDCLTDTPYDPGYEAAYSLERTDGHLEMSIFPTSPGGAVLKLVGFDNPSKFLQPADSVSRQILSTYDCDPNANRTSSHFDPFSFFVN